MLSVCVVGVFEGNVVGSAIVDSSVDAHFLRANYQLEDFLYWGKHLNKQHLQLHHFFLHPIFNSKRRHFLKVILLIGNLEVNLIP